MVLFFNSCAYRPLYVPLYKNQEPHKKTGITTVSKVFQQPVDVKIQKVQIKWLDSKGEVQDTLPSLMIEKAFCQNLDEFHSYHCNSALGELRDRYQIVIEGTASEVNYLASWWHLGQLVLPVVWPCQPVQAAPFFKLKVNLYDAAGNHIRMVEVTEDLRKNMFWYGLLRMISIQDFVDERFGVLLHTAARMLSLQPDEGNISG
jgi:hypothetical protein